MVIIMIADEQANQAFIHHMMRTLVEQEREIDEDEGDREGEKNQEEIIGSYASTIRPLTGRESEILHLMRKGQKNREIANELAIAESTVHKHIQNIFEKLHARNRTEAIYLTSGH